jgi:hypothetical protein
MANRPEPPYHLLLEGGEIAVAVTALGLLIADVAHEPEIRRLAREVLAALQAGPDEGGIISVSLAPQQMRITHTAIKLLLDDLQRGEAAERELLRSILGKLPDEHTMRAIELDD